MPRLELNIAELEELKPVRLELNGTGIVVVRTEAGVHAFEDICPHAGWRLSEGEMVDGVLECPGHGWQFRLETGQCTGVPTYRLKPVTVTRAGDTITLELAQES